jgi:Uncharacterized protein conserved in bacteria (DUF2252)
MDIIESTLAFETWLKKQLKAERVEKDLDEKHARMCEGPFPFLRATYYRWAETILVECPKLAQAPHVVAVGDIHLENFGIWRDDEGRLIWGVNDFDEAAQMPYALDLVRLGVSAVLGCPDTRSMWNMCDDILTGYQCGLRAPLPIVLDDEYAWLRDVTVASNKDRADFWRKMRKLTKKNKKGGKPSPGYVNALRAAMPEPKLKMEFGPRSAGLGSLGRPRWIAMAEWRGGSIVREAKAVLPSAWTLANGRRAQRLYGGTIATARYRAPDPWYALDGKIVVRRLSPNSKKLEADKDPKKLADSRLLELMGRDLAAVHLGLGDHHDAISNDLKGRKRNWLHSAVGQMAELVRGEQKQWKQWWKARH